MFRALRDKLFKSEETAAAGGVKKGEEKKPLTEASTPSRGGGDEENADVVYSTPARAARKPFDPRSPAAFRSPIPADEME